MRKHGLVFWLAVALAGTTMLAVVFVFALLRSFSGTVPGIAKGSVVSIDLAYPYPEDPLYAVGGPFLDVSALTFRDLLFALDSAKSDPRVEMLLLRLRGSGLSWAQASEVRAKLQELRGEKRIVAFIEFASSRDYYVASIADEVYLHPRGALHLTGVRAEMMFYAEGLRKLGVEPEFERFGAYKDAPDVFLRERMSESSREATGALVTTIHDAIVDAIAEGRELGRERVVEAIERGPLTGTQAMDLGLVDGLEFLDEIDGDEGKSVDVRDYRQATNQAPTFGADARIAIIYGIGAIVPGPSGEDAVFGRVMGADTIAAAFREAREDRSIDAVVFRIDSPGGSDVASDIIWREAALTREEKPVIVSMAGVAASGGYWIATASDTIIADPLTITGSIGIYAGKFNLAGLYGKVGVGVDGISSTANADFFSSSRSFTPEERKRLAEMLRDGYDAFLRRVSDARGMTTDEVHAIAQGRVWSGRMALEVGLVDELGGLSRAVAVAKEQAGVASDASVELRIYPRKKSVFELLLQSLPRTDAGTSSLWELGDLDVLLRRSPLGQLAARGAPLAMMPYRITLE